MTENKNQHYLPRFYFRLFSENEKTIEIYNLKRKLCVAGPISSVCSEDNFYGVETERSLSPLEQKQAETIKDLKEKLNG